MALSIVPTFVEGFAVGAFSAVFLETAPREYARRRLVALESTELAVDATGALCMVLLVAEALLVIGLTSATATSSASVTVFSTVAAAA